MIRKCLRQNDATTSVCCATICQATQRLSRRSATRMPEFVDRSKMYAANTERSARLLAAVQACRTASIASIAIDHSVERIVEYANEKISIQNTYDR